jgi:lipid-binding SYLF domain-containing protein
MIKILSTLVAFAFAASAAPAFAEDAAAAQAQKAGQEAKEAGMKAQMAGDKAMQAGEMAEKSGDEAKEVAKRSAKKDEALKDANGAVTALKHADPSLSRLFKDAAGYAVFATVGKGGAVIGGAHGTGVLFEKGSATGSTTLSQVTIGAQLGGQSYTEVIFFDSKEAVANFRKGEFAMAAQVSAVAVKAGASADAKYQQGVAVFTLSKGGLMAEASIGGQKFSFEPYAKRT